MIHVLIVDDRDVVRDALRLVFSKTTDIKVMDEASDGKEALHLIEKNDYDVVIMDINMPIMNGIEASQRIVKLKPRIKILTNSFYLNNAYVIDMMRVGARGFITKGEDNENYIEAVRTVASGAVYVSEKLDKKTYEEALDHLNSLV